jgi:hypothetical protein
MGNAQPGAVLEHNRGHRAGLAAVNYSAVPFSSQYQSHRDFIKRGYLHKGR